MTAHPGIGVPETPLRVALRLLRPFWLISLLAVVLGLASGLATAALLGRINRGLQAPSVADTGSVFAFLGLVLVAVLGRALVGALNSTIGQRLIAALRQDIAGRILQTPIASLEQHKQPRLNAVLNNDVETISAFTFSVSGLAVALAITVGGLGYLASLSVPAFLLAIIALGGGMVVTNHSRRIWMSDYAEVRKGFCQGSGQCSWATYLVVGIAALQWAE